MNNELDYNHNFGVSWFLFVYLNYLIGIKVYD